MMTEPRDSRCTVAEAEPSDGTVSGVPSSRVKLTGNETGVVPVLVKYSAEYQPPPKANWGRIALTGGAWACATTEQAIKKPTTEYRCMDSPFVSVCVTAI